MSDLNKITEKSKNLEETPYFQELMDYQLRSFKFYLRKWMMIILVSMLLIQGLSFMYYNDQLLLLKKIVDYRYFLTKESLEDIHKVKIEKGRVIWREGK